MDEQRQYGGGGSDAYYAVKELQAEANRLREENTRLRRFVERMAELGLMPPAGCIAGSVLDKGRSEIPLIYLQDEGWAWVQELKEAAQEALKEANDD